MNDDFTCQPSPGDGGEEQDGGGAHGWPRNGGAPKQSFVDTAGGDQASDIGGDQGSAAGSV